MERNKSLRRAKPQPVKAEATAKNDQFGKSDRRLPQTKGIDSTTQTASLQTTPEAVSKVQDAKPPPQTMDTSKLLGDIDANLKKSGKSVEELPAPPEAHAAFKDPAVAEGSSRQDKDQPGTATRRSQWRLVEQHRPKAQESGLGAIEV